MASHLHKKWKVLEELKKFSNKYGENSLVVSRHQPVIRKKEKVKHNLGHLLNKQFPVPAYPRYKNAPVARRGASYRITAADRAGVVRNNKKRAMELSLDNDTSEV